MEVNITGENFEKEVISSELPVLVDFWAPWCGPCQRISPYIEEIAKDYAGRLKVCKLNVDEASEIATKYSVMSIPALMFFNKGKVVETKVGAMNKLDLEKTIQTYL